MTDLKSRLDSDSIRPGSTSEYITFLSHYYRGELARMTSWRNRIDQTSHWAIAAVAAMLSVSLSSPDSHHGVLLFAMVLVYLLLHIESRRYRFFDVYRTRVRVLERNFFAEVFSPQNTVSGAPRLSDEWFTQLGETLRRPVFTISMNEAMARRLRRNYIWIFVVLLAAWFLKTSSEMPQSPRQLLQSTGTLATNARIGGLSGWVVLGLIVVFYSRMFYVMFKYNTPKGELVHGEVHV